MELTKKEPIENFTLPFLLKQIFSIRNLYHNNKKHKVITILGVDNYRCEVTIPNGCEDIPAVNFLCGHTMNELITAERNATEYALLKSGHLNHTIMLPEVNAFTIGELMYFYELETAYVGAMMGIDTFNQPGVEEGKNATYALLGRPGYEEKRNELDARPKKMRQIYYLMGENLWNYR